MDIKFEENPSRHLAILKRRLVVKVWHSPYRSGVEIRLLLDFGHGREEARRPLRTGRPFMLTVGTILDTVS